MLDMFLNVFELFWNALDLFLPSWSFIIPDTFLIFLLTSFHRSLSSFLIFLLASMRAMISSSFFVTPAIFVVLRPQNVFPVRLFLWCCCCCFVSPFIIGGGCSTLAIFIVLRLQNVDFIFAAAAVASFLPLSSTAVVSSHFSVCSLFAASQLSFSLLLQLFDWVHHRAHWSLRVRPRKTRVLLLWYLLPAWFSCQIRGSAIRIW